MLSGLDFGVVVFMTSGIHPVSATEVRSDRTESENNRWRILNGESPELDGRAKIWGHARYPPYGPPVPSGVCLARQRRIGQGRGIYPAGTPAQQIRVEKF